MRRSTARRAQRRFRTVAAAGLILFGLAVVLVYGFPLMTGTPPLVAVPGQGGERTPRPVPDDSADAARGAEAQLLVETPAEAEVAAGRELAQAPAGPGQPIRVELPRLGLNIPVLPMSLPADRRVNPPSNGFAYWISNYGRAGAGATNTTYLAAHSWNLGYAAFNGLMDIQAGAGKVRQGDTVRLTTPEGVTSYKVTAAAGYAKSTLEARDDLWAAKPGRLVLLTCFQLNDAGATENYVVYAEQSG